MAKAVELTQGMYALVDDEDYERVSKHKWYAVCRPTSYYAERRIPNCGGLRQPLANFIMEVPNGIIVDHANGDGLDNQRSNLRTATKKQNNRNRRKQVSPTSSRYKGVSWSNATKKWKAEIRVDGKSIYLGIFHTELKAAKAYDIAARRYHGKFARVNFPTTEESNVL